MEIKNQIQKIINRVGYHVRRYPDENQRRKMKLLASNDISLIIDIGANTGQYASGLRAMGYMGKIISFEPLTDAYKTLKNIARHDSSWTVHNMAIGDEDEQAIIHVSSNSASSSLLEMNSNLITEAAKDVYFTGHESVVVRRLDTLRNEYFDLTKENIFLKIDAQGYEGKILAGASETLKHIRGLQLEMPLIELYKGQMLFAPLLNMLYSLGFELQGLEQGFHHPETLQLYEMDGVFFKRK